MTSFTLDLSPLVALAREAPDTLFGEDVLPGLAIDARFLWE